jgi:hypothetical protein
MGNLHKKNAQRSTRITPSEAKRLGGCRDPQQVLYGTRMGTQSVQCGTPMDTSSRARRAHISVAVGFNPRKKMFPPSAKPRSGVILSLKYRRYAAPGADGYLFPWVKTLGYPYICPTGTEACVFAAAQPTKSQSPKSPSGDLGVKIIKLFTYDE